MCWCGPGKLAVIVDPLLREELRMICKAHDEAYNQGGTEADRKAADDAFEDAVDNIKWKWNPFTRLIGELFTVAVKEYGGAFFNYHG